MISNTLQTLQMVLSYSASIARTKRNILILSFSSGILSVPIFLAAGLLDAAIPSVVISIRYLLYFFKDKYETNVVFYVCTIAQIIVGIFAWEDVGSMIPALLPVVCCVYYWYGSALVIKCCGVVTSALWVLYYVSNGLYITAINSAIGIVLLVVSIIQIRHTKGPICKGTGQRD